MSNRSLIEINHDFGPLDGDLHFVAALAHYLRCADNRTAERLERWGVKVISMRHHSEKFIIDGEAEGFPPQYLTKAKAPA